MGNANNNNNNNNNSLSWMYDPLLNVSIVLMFMICLLFAKKGYDLSKELQQIQELPPVVMEQQQRNVAGVGVGVGVGGSGGVSSPPPATPPKLPPTESASSSSSSSSAA